MRAYRALDHTAEALAAARQIPAPEGLIEEIKVHLHAGQAAEALARGLAGLAAFGADAGLIFLTGAAMVASDEPAWAAQAQARAAELIQRLPADPRGWWLACWVHARAGRLALAAETAAGLLGAQGAVVPALCTYALIALLQGQLDHAHRALARCAARAPSQHALVARVRQALVQPHAAALEPVWRALLAAYFVPHPSARAIVGR